MRRKAKISIKLGIIVVLLLILEATVTQEWSINDVARLIQGAQEASLSLVGENSFFFQLSPPWGNAVVDGKPVAYLPQATTETPLSLAPGQHTLQWNAEPFPSQNCTFTVPVHSLPGQNCVLTELTDNSRADATYMVSFPARPALTSLAPEQQHALLQAMQAYLDTLQSHETVHPGEPFSYNATSPIQTATHPMSANLRFLLDTDVNAPAVCQGPLIGAACQNSLGVDCRLFCTQYSSQPETWHGIPAWEVFVVTRPTWTYHDLIASSGSQKNLQNLPGDQQYTFLQIFWDQHSWHVTAHRAGDSSFDDPNCTLMISKVLALPSTVAEQSSGTNRSLSPVAQRWSFASNQNRALGCLSTVPVISTAPGKGTQTQQENAYFLWRFGVFSAVNAAAHLLQPRAPITNPDLQSIIQEIKQKPAIIS
ncbi:hypothetical protein [Dictyobacter formicarum]|uniref:Sporulation stage II protein D amidase enhancer LytB N-terminal domain-containing protein n=1 Tax=Dictyobacter formicarum TaxID=2778368 RepID=A0ABQ3VL19_9CHLR|nr:hypothetical protein [Dictyobacter formicarum]GHO86303.1 hypothetical protein KSZ_43090 [Dictyobacter formicarum]